MVKIENRFFVEYQRKDKGIRHTALQDYRSGAV